MSDVLDRLRVAPAAVSSTRSEPAAPIWVRGAFAATWAVAVGATSLIVLALIVWAADSRSEASAAAATRLGAQLWLLADRTPMRISGGTLAIPPLGLTLLLGMLMARATAIVTRSSRCTDSRELAVIVTSVTVPYAVLATVLAAVAPSSTIRPSVGAAFVSAALVAGLAATIGAGRASGLAGQAWRALPPDLRASVESVAAASAVVLTAAVLLVFGSVLVHGHHVWAITRSYRGTPGELSMALLSVLFLPNAVVFALGYLVGPGFAVGAGTSVGLRAAHVGVIPRLPLLAAVPGGRAPWPVVAMCAAVVVLAGSVAGWRVARRVSLTVADRVRGALFAGAMLGVAVAALAGYAGGPAGPGRLRAVGPSPWQVGLAVAVEISLVAVVVVLGSAWSSRGRPATLDLR